MSQGRCDVARVHTALLSSLQEGATPPPPEDLVSIWEKRRFNNEMAEGGGWWYLRQSVYWLRELSLLDRRIINSPFTKGKASDKNKQTYKTL